MPSARRIFTWLFSRGDGLATHLVARWLFLRALGLVFFSAFFALLFPGGGPVRGLIGSHGILSAADYLQALRPLGLLRLWYAPTLLWLAPSDTLLIVLCWAGLIASLLLVANILPRPALLVCFLCFLSFAAAAQDFSGYQSDGMLLEAGFLSLFVVPSGLRPGLGEHSLPSRAAYFLLLWEWFRIYFQSGVVKLASGDPTWRNLTAMYEYYQNGPLPTWIGWYLQQLPHWFHIGTAAVTLIMELVIVWTAFLSRRMRIVCFWIVTVWQAGVIATANYAFLNYLVLVLAFLLLDDRYLHRLAAIFPTRSAVPEVRPRPWLTLPGTALAAFLLIWIFYATSVPLLQMLWTAQPFSFKPVAALEPFRIANRYGLFANMTPHRYEIEFQGSNDGHTWLAYPFRFKPQDVHDRPRIYAPYQPRFDWNLWFASLGTWRDNAIVPRTEELLLISDPAAGPPVLGLFAANPFPSAPPRFVRAVLWQYWFSTPQEKRTQGVWWRRQFLGTYAPTLERLPGGQLQVTEAASLIGPMDP